MANDAGPRCHRSEDVFLLRIFFRRMTAETQPSRRIFDEHESVIAAVRIMTAGAVAVGEGLVNDVAAALDVAESTKLGLGNGQREQVAGRTARRVARITLLLCRRAV